MKLFSFAATTTAYILSLLPHSAIAVKELRDVNTGNAAASSGRGSRRRELDPYSFFGGRCIEDEYCEDGVTYYRFVTIPANTGQSILDIEREAPEGCRLTPISGPEQITEIKRWEDRLVGSSCLNEYFVGIYKDVAQIDIDDVADITTRRSGWINIADGTSIDTSLWKANEPSLQNDDYTAVLSTCTDTLNTRGRGQFTSDRTAIYQCCQSVPTPCEVGY